MNTGKAVFGIVTISSAYVWLVNRMCSYNVYITKTEDGYKARVGDHDIGLSSKPYYHLNRGLFFDTFKFGDNEFRTYKRITAAKIAI